MPKYDQGSPYRTTTATAAAVLRIIDHSDDPKRAEVAALRLLARQWAQVEGAAAAAARHALDAAADAIEAAFD